MSTRMIQAAENLADRTEGRDQEARDRARSSRPLCNYTNPDGLPCLNDAEVAGRCNLHPNQ